jgi:hypothetical protein
VKLHVSLSEGKSEHPEITSFLQYNMVASQKLSAERTALVKHESYESPLFGISEFYLN